MPYWFEALQSARFGYWYVDRRDCDGGRTVFGGQDSPLTEELARALASALNALQELAQ